MTTTPLPDAEYLPRRTVAEQIARGRSLRKEVPPARLARWAPSEERADPIAILERQAAHRDAELVPIRHGRMLTSPFAFFRGGAAIMASDLAGTPVGGLTSQLCGDAHLLNYGLFETPERTLVFGLNDFDETLPGPIEWDVKRLAASIEVAGQDLGFTSKQRTAAVTAAARSYREAMLEFAGQRNLEVWYARLPAAELRDRLSTLGDRKSGKEVAKRLAKALRHDHLGAFDRHLDTTAGTPRFVSNPPFLVPVDELLQGEARERYVEVIQEFLTQYRESLAPDRRLLLETYRFVAMARKVVGVGSVGTRAWIVLMMGRDSSDPLLLQLKEAQPSVLAPYAGSTAYESEGRRVVEGQRLMQAASDHMLGWYRLPLTWDGGQRRDFYVRQMWDGKASIDVAHLTPKGLAVYSASCGWTLARGHARAGDRIALASYLGEDERFDRAIAEFASAYAETNQQDHARLQEAVESGRLVAAAGE